MGRVALLLIAILISWLPDTSRAQKRQPTPKALYSWSRMPDLPDSIGVAGACAGVSGDALIIAGGAQFPVSLFEGGEKVWTDRVYVLQ